ncbi:FAD binding domain-containing protein [Actinomadura fulvescens]|uniref:Xanthine dehydrogenase family protein subunit M n=1 Tax=Actinomadura fulvescens TaxID=46160 RepID=A0ABP6C394_9ACTN
MEFVRAPGWRQALEVRAAEAGALPVAGGTDVMVEVNAGRCRPEALLDLSPVSELTEWDTAGECVRVGAGVTFTRLIEELGGPLPGLAQAARTVGSRQIRNRGTLGGNLGTAATKGVCHPLLLACAADIEVASAAAGPRMIAAERFYRPDGSTALRADELIRAVHVPAATGPQYFAKVGLRNAMVTAVCSFALVLDTRRRRVGTGIGAAVPAPRSASAAERFLASELDWQGRRPLPDETVEHFARLVGQAADPEDDLRCSAAYRRHALGVIARRTLRWAWNDHRSS